MNDLLAIGLVLLGVGMLIAAVAAVGAPKKPARRPPPPPVSDERRAAAVMLGLRRLRQLEDIDRRAMQEAAERAMRTTRRGFPRRSER